MMPHARRTSVPPLHPFSLALLLVGIAACGPARAPVAGAPAPASAPSAAPSGGIAARTPSANDAGVRQARADSARLPWTEADARFMTGMIGHHAQALTMARLAPTHTTNAEIRTLAARIINAQQDEIGLMQTWLRDRLRPAPEPSYAIPAAGASGAAAAGAGAAQGAGHEHHGGAHGASMPGMLSADELRALDAARGEDFDILFLRSMIRHHQGATRMVRELFATPGAGQDEAVFRFATDVNVDQETEIARMQRMLAERLFGRRER